MTDTDALADTGLCETEMEDDKDRDGDGDRELVTEGLGLGVTDALADSDTLCERVVDNDTDTDEESLVEADGVSLTDGDELILRDPLRDTGVRVGVGDTDGDAPNDSEAVGDVQRGNGELALYRFEQGEDSRLARRIDRCERLIEQ